MIEIGTKVVPHSKSRGDRGFPCSLWQEAMRKGQNYMVVTHFSKRADEYTLSISENEGGNYYTASDFTLYHNILEEGDEI